MLRPCQGMLRDAKGGRGDAGPCQRDAGGMPGEAEAMSRDAEGCRGDAGGMLGDAGAMPRDVRGMPDVAGGAMPAASPSSECPPARPSRLGRAAPNYISHGRRGRGRCGAVRRGAIY